MSEARDRFMSFVEKSTCGCWNWTGGKAGIGYGMFWVNGATRRAHRVAYSLFKGPLQDVDVVRHTCDNPGCVNPEHLQKGTHADNVSDKMAKDRHRSPKGEEHGIAKLTEEAVRDIRSGRLSGAAFARLYGVSPALVSMVKNGQGWRHVS
jgi:hypothetical protein